MFSNFGHFWGCGTVLKTSSVMKQLPFFVILTLLKILLFKNELKRIKNRLKWNWTLKRQFWVEKVKWSWKRKCVYGLDEWVGHLGNFRRRTLCTYLPFLACLLGGIYLSFSLFSCVHILIYRLIWDSRARAHDASSSLLLLLLHLVAHFQMTFQSFRAFLSLSLCFSFSISICKGVRPSSIGVHINDGMRCCFASKVLVDEPWVQKCCVSTTLICFILQFCVKNNSDFATKVQLNPIGPNGSLECIFLHGSWFVSMLTKLPRAQMGGHKKGTEKACLLQVHFYISSNYFRAVELLLGKKGCERAFFPILDL